MIAYPFYVELAGNAAKDPATGLGCKVMLEKLIRDPQYQRRTDGDEGGKATMIKDVIRSYRSLARSELLKENKDLRDMVMEQQQMRAKQMQGQ